jgi:cell wall-associated NlpC family hydrolase
MNSAGVRRDRGRLYDDDELHLAAWSADVDALFAPFRGGGALLAGISPYAFAGLGGLGTRFRDAPDTSVAAWSYGFGATLRLVGPLGVEGEARRRTPIHRDEDALRDDFGRGWEYRLGVRIGFGGSRGGRRYASRPPAPRGETHVPAHRHGHRGGLAAGVMREGERHLGTRYRYGGDSPGEGFDCSGFVQYVYGREGVRLPRTSRQQAAIGTHVTPSVGDLRDGDLVFFSSDGRGIDHVAIYAGDGRILHSTASGGGVRYDRLDGTRGAWFRERMVAARRVGAAGASWAPRASWAPGDDELDPPDRAPSPR